MRRRLWTAAVATATIAVVALLLPGPQAVADVPVRGAGVWVTSVNGLVEAFGDAPSQGSVSPGGDPVVDLAPTPTGRGYWVLTQTGHVLVRCDAGWFGDGLPSQGSFVAVAGTPTGRGYWLLNNKNQLFGLGDAPVLARTSGSTKSSATDLVATPDGKGLWSTSNQGEISSFGAAPSLSAGPTKAAVVGIQSSPSGKGVLLATAAGQVMKAGDAVQRGDLVGQLPSGVNVIDLAATYDGRGYWLLLSNRTIRAFGSAVGLGPSVSTAMVVALAATPWVNRPPVAGDDGAATDEDTPVTFDVGGNDSDPDGDALTWAAQTQPSHGTLALVSGSRFRYSPAQDFFGTDSATYQVTDLYGASATATVRFTVRPVNDPPVAGDDRAAVDEDSSVLIDVLANDTDVDSTTLTPAVTTTPDHGTASVEPGGIRYTPVSDYQGSDVFTYTVDDGSGGADTATVTITVNAVDDLPVAQPDSYQVDQGQTLTVAAPGVLANDSDPDGDSLTAELVTGPATGTFSLSSDGSFTWTPPSSATTADGFTYRAVGSGAPSSPVTVTLTIKPRTTAQDSNATFVGPGPEISNDDYYDITSYGDPTNDLQLGTVEHIEGQIRYVPDPDVQGTEHLVFGDGRTLDIEVVDEE
ncbi:MAG: Ig-like domain-containing protein [Mycobacteriales bacterium]